jgi:multidrug efflux pump
MFSNGGFATFVGGKGPGAEMRRALGLAVFSGKLGVTLFGIFLTPVFFCVIQWFGARKNGDAASSDAP